MPIGQYILVDGEIQERILREIAELKSILIKGQGFEKERNDDELMDTADLVRYLKVDRKTIYNYRAKGLRCVRKDKGRLFFWKSDVDNFFGKNK